MAKGRKGAKSKKDAKNQEITKASGDIEKMPRKVYEKELLKLQVGLCQLQEWIREKGLRVIIVFEGRDTAGKGGTIKALTERVSPRVFRVVALPAPTEREKSQMFIQRYIERFPAAGEVVIFDRSWYNRAGVEHVMGFVSDKTYMHFLELCPEIEKHIVDAGIVLVKLWLEVGMDEQERRFNARIEDPLRQWKLSDMDLKSYGRWYDYSRARDAMLEMTDSTHAPWYIVRNDDKKRGRLNSLSHILSAIPYKKMQRSRAKLPARDTRNAYDDDASIKERRFVEQRF